MAERERREREREREGRGIERREREREGEREGERERNDECGIENVTHFAARSLARSRAVWENEAETSVADSHYHKGVFSVGEGGEQDRNFFSRGAEIEEEELHEGRLRITPLLANSRVSKRGGGGRGKLQRSAAPLRRRRKSIERHFIFQPSHAAATAAKDNQLQFSHKASSLESPGSLCQLNTSAGKSIFTSYNVPSLNMPGLYDSLRIRPAAGRTI